MAKKKRIDPIPEQFTSYEEAVDFWDIHDTTDYPDAFQIIQVETKFRSRHYEVEIEARGRPASTIFSVSILHIPKKLSF